MKVIFLDVDGVLNSDKSLMLDDALEDDLILKLKTLVDKTGAKIILSSAWRFCFNPLRILMKYLDKYNLYLSGMTQNGVSITWLKSQGYEPTTRFIDTREDINGNEYEVTTDRGAEIYKWLSNNPDVESFVIFDDEAFDIARYFSNNFIKTNPRIGLTEENIQQAEKILTKATT